MHHGVFVNVMDTLDVLQSSHKFGGLEPPRDGEKILLGICAMDKKANSKPMRAIMQRLTSTCQVVLFGNETILKKPVEEWPRCHCLISFHSDGFPLEKAEAYAELRKPFLVNQIRPQRYLMDRRHVYRLLQEAGVPVPKHIIVNRGPESPSGIPVQVHEESQIIEGDDYIEVDGVRLKKPFMEKPVAGDDHNIYLYYPRAEGGGHKRLFRKIGNRSSEFYPDESNIRRTGSYIYEEFLATEGTDVKVYAVTGQYAHAEARKSPVVDGKVIRDSTGHEIRYPIMLSSYEKELARRITGIFSQRVCGFDMLRSNGKSFVCDVNGWSFVKKNLKYYDDTAAILGRLMKRAMGTFFDLRQGMSPSKSNHSSATTSDFDDDDDDCTTDNESSSVGGMVHEELRCVIGVVRHGDRTPKQKLKMVVSSEKFLSLYNKYRDAESPHGEVKLKSAVQLGDVLNCTREVLESAAKQNGQFDEDSDAEFGQLEKLSQMKTVLEMHGRFKGVNRKVQLKPLKWRELPNVQHVKERETEKEVPVSPKSVSSMNDVNNEETENATLKNCEKQDNQGTVTKVVSEIQLILKWGGVLTPFGREAAELIGRSFRTQIYPGKDGLIRLHSTYRHDLKIYSSDEGRVQVTAAAFAKGLLDLEGHLTPILASLVRKSPDVNKILDDATAAQKSMNIAKDEIKAMLNSSSNLKEQLDAKYPACKLAKSVADSMQNIGAPREAMEQLHGEIKMFAMQFRMWLRRAQGGLRDVNELTSTDVESSENSEGGSAAFSLGEFPGQNVNGRITLQFLELAYARWSKLDREFYNRKKQVYDISKIPDIYDCAKFDTVHNPTLLGIEPHHLKRIFHLSQSLADFVVPQEYGFTWQDKFDIGAKIASPLIQKISADLQNSVEHVMKLSSKEEDETVFRLDKKAAKAMGIKSRERHVRTRLYFTSESHLHALLNVLRFAGQHSRESETNTQNNYNENNDDEMSQDGEDDDTCQDDKDIADQDGDSDSNDFDDDTDQNDRDEFADLEDDEYDVPSPMESAIRRIENMSELGYLTHIVFRLYEIKDNSRSKGVDMDMSRFRVAVSVSDGVSVDVDAAAAALSMTHGTPVHSEPPLPSVAEDHPPTAGEMNVGLGASQSCGSSDGSETSTCGRSKSIRSLSSEDHDHYHCETRSQRSVSSGSEEDSPDIENPRVKSRNDDGRRSISPASALHQKTTPFKLHMEPANPMTTLWQDIRLSQLMSLFQSVTGSREEQQLRIINVQHQISMMMNLPPAKPGESELLDAALLPLPETAAVTPSGNLISPISQQTHFSS